MVAQRDPETIIQMMQELKESREQYLRKAWQAKELIGIDFLEELDGSGLIPPSGTPSGISLFGRSLSFKDAVLLVVQQNPQGLTPGQVLEKVLGMGVTTKSQTPRKMASIALGEWKKAGRTMNKDTRWYPVGDKGGEGSNG